MANYSWFRQPVYIILKVEYNYISIQCLAIITNFVSSNTAHGEVYSIQLYVIKFVNDLRQVGGFFQDTPVYFTSKIDRHDITKVLLKVVLNTINLILNV